MNVAVVEAVTVAVCDAVTVAVALRVVVGVVDWEVVAVFEAVDAAELEAVDVAVLVTVDVTVAVNVVVAVTVSQLSHSTGHSFLMLKLRVTPPLHASLLNLIHDPGSMRPEHIGTAVVSVDVAEVVAVLVAVADADVVCDDVADVAPLTDTVDKALDVAVDTALALAVDVWEEVAVVVTQRDTSIVSFRSTVFTMPDSAFSTACTSASCACRSPNAWHVRPVAPRSCSAATASVHVLLSAMRRRSLVLSFPKFWHVRFCLKTTPQGGVCSTD